MVDLNGIADMTKRINETLARHGMDEKKTYPSYEAPTPTAAAGRPAYNGRLSDNRYHSSRESRDREIVTATPTGKYIMSSIYLYIYAQLSFVIGKCESYFNKISEIYRLSYN